MSQIKPSHLILSALLAFALGGCGEKNDKALFSPESGHSSGWVKAHKTSARANVASCAECHGDNYDGGVSNVSCMSATAVSGFTCHATSPAANLTGCLSCHGVGPFGTASPNTKGAHTKHTALPGIGCDTCHLNAGFGTSDHAKADAAGGRKKATVASSATIPFVYNANGTCSNVSCHGVTNATPAWSAAFPDVNNTCIECHAKGTAVGAPQYNSYYSGVNSLDGVDNLHTFHIELQGANCTDCHNIGTLNDYQKHFGGLATQTFTNPGNTVGGAATKIGIYTVSTKTCSNNNAACHSFSAHWIQ